MMRDHPKHPNVIMGGMFGSRVNATIITTNHLKIFQTILNESKGNWRKGTDQKLLQEHLWPVARTDLVAHDSYHCLDTPDGFRPFPTQRDTRNFYDGVHYDNFVGSNGGSMFSPCPVECRPRNHQDWQYC